MTNDPTPTADPARPRSGITTQQMLSAPPRSMYIWPNALFSYPRALAIELGRRDLKFAAPDELFYPAHWFKLRYADIVVDHAVQITPQRAFALATLLDRGLDIFTARSEDKALIERARFWSGDDLRTIASPRPPEIAVSARDPAKRTFADTVQAVVDVVRARRAISAAAATPAPAAHRAPEVIAAELAEANVGFDPTYIFASGEDYRRGAERWAKILALSTELAVSRAAHATNQPTKDQK